MIDQMDEWMGNYAKITESVFQERTLLRLVQEQLVGWGLLFWRLLRRS